MTYDICIINGIEAVIAQPGIERQMTVDLRGTGSGSVITGVQKVIQRFVILLFTEQGSVLYRPNDGCRFMIDVKRGLLRNTADVSQSFASAMMDIRRQFALLEKDSDALTEKLDDVEFLGATIGDGRVSLSVKLLTQAGEGPEVNVSLPTLPRQ